jgi:microcompartment protein CcmK/EutM
VDHPVFDREGPWTEDAFLALPRAEPGDPAGPGAESRIELVDGALIVGPGTAPERGGVVARVREAVAAALPDGLRVIGPVPLRLGPDCVLLPDLVVTRAPVEAADEVAGDEAGAGAEEPVTESAGDTAEDAAGDTAGAEVLDAADALMVLEIVGRGHGITDRSFKPQLYARSRIPYSLLIDHDGPFAVANMIISGRYHEYARAAAGETLRVEEPFGLELDLDAVARPETVPAGG